MHMLNTRETFMGFENSKELQEIHLLRHGLVDDFKALYQNHIGKKTSKGKPIIKGFKSPEILQSEDFMTNMEIHFPETDLIVSMRHPVYHFQSMYNFKFRSKKFTGERPDPLTLIGNCGFQCFNNCVPDDGNNRGVCTQKSYFHYGLSRIMLTPMNTTEELDLVDNNDYSRHPNYRGNVFLLELGQLGDANNTRRGSFLNDLERFLGLELNSVDIPDRNKYNEKYINICDSKYQPIRDLLVEVGTKASKWIKEYLLQSPRVTISNPDHFLQLIEKWQRDPCL